MFRCAICQESMSLEQISAIKCGHTFHFQCICRWMAHSKTCPSCRLAVSNLHDDVIAHVYLECQSMNSFLDGSFSDDAEKKCQALEASLNQANDKLASRDKLISEMRAVLDRLEQEKKELECKVTGHVKSISLLRSQCEAFDAIQQENVELTSKNEKMRKKLEVLRKLDILLNKSNEEAQEMVNDLSMESFEQTKVLLGVLKDRLREAGGRNERLDYELRRLRNKLRSGENNKKLVKELQEKLESIENGCSNKLRTKHTSVENEPPPTDETCAESDNDSLPEKYPFKRAKRFCHVNENLPKSDNDSNDGDIDVPSEDEEIFGFASTRNVRRRGEQSSSTNSSRPSALKSSNRNAFSGRPNGLGGMSRDFGPGVVQSKSITASSSAAASSTLKCKRKESASLKSTATIFNNKTATTRSAKKPKNSTTVSAKKSAVNKTVIRTVPSSSFRTDRSIITID